MYSYCESINDSFAQSFVTRVLASVAYLFKDTATMHVFGEMDHVNTIPIIFIATESTRTARGPKRKTNL
jgi:hypothetical protein